MPCLSFQGPRLLEQFAPGAGDDEIWLGEVIDCTSYPLQPTALF